MTSNCPILAFVCLVRHLFIFAFCFLLASAPFKRVVRPGVKVKKMGVPRNEGLHPARARRLVGKPNRKPLPPTLANRGTLLGSVSAQSL